jgi:hypothetical protein
MAKAKMIYQDRAGNKLYQRYIKTRGVVQISAKNREGLLINPQGTHLLMKKAGLKRR